MSREPFAKLPQFGSVSLPHIFINESIEPVSASGETFHGLDVAAASACIVVEISRSIFELNGDGVASDFVCGNRVKKDANTARPHILLLDEPELCLHPNAVREACKVLYDLPKSGNWQVMVTTHSPVFIDFWRDNTSIVRVERQANGNCTGTTIYRPKNAQLDNDDKECLKLLNLCDPYVAEFFFGGKTILVEGDTEFTAFTYIMQQDPDRYKDVHIVRARGKATICSLSKILNQFGMPYAILHDSDTTQAMRDGKPIANPAWTQNSNILALVSDALAKKRVRLVASITSFEPAYFGFNVKSDKPCTAWEHLKIDKDARDRVAGLLDALLNFGKPLPPGAVEWDDIKKLEAALPL